MSESDENQKVQKITKLLEMGGTMLANHHECGAPLFRYKGKVLCPVCDFQDKQETEKETSVEFSQVDTLVRNKIKSIASSLENETELQRVKEKLECIELGIKVLRLLENKP